MTTIVTKDGAIAADRKRIGPHICYVSKVWPSRDGSIFADAGDASWGERFREWYEAGAKPETRDALVKLMHDIGCDGAAVQVRPDKMVVLWEGGFVPLPMLTTIYGVGSGSAYALGAISAGASLQDAIKHAATWDECTSPDCDVITLEYAASLIKRKRKR